MQFDPLKPTLKPHGIGRSKPKFNELLSNVAFDFNLRRHIQDIQKQLNLDDASAQKIIKVRRCRLILRNPS